MCFFIRIPPSVSLEISKKMCSILTKRDTFLVPRSNKVVSADITLSKHYFTFFLKHCKPFVTVDLNRYCTIKYKCLYLIILLKLSGLNTAWTFNLTLWCQRQVFWAHNKSAIWHPTEGFLALFGLFFSKYR